MNVLLVLIVAAILHASWNAFVKGQKNGVITITIVSSVMAILVLPLTLFVGLPTKEIWGYLTISMLAHTLYFYSMTRAYSIYDFSIAYPFARGLAPLITVIILLIFLNKKIHTLEIIGILIIVSSILMLLPRKISDISIKDFISMLYFPFAIAFYTVVDAEGIQHAKNPYQYIIWNFIVAAIPLLLYGLITNKSELFKVAANNKLKFILAGIVATIAYTLILWAYTQAPTHYVASVRESSIIFASLIGLYFFKENGAKKRLFAALILFIGIFVLQLHLF
tara:strand:- start:513 stop:1349 length:837 start_codon:yes stop_codon:yes gene_type:complete